MKESVEGDFYDWLVISACDELKKTEKVQQATSRLIEDVPRGLSSLHHLYLSKEQNRLAKIKADKEEKKRKFEEERSIRRSRRQLLRISRAKRRLKEEIESKVYSKKSFETEVTSLKLVTFSDEDPEPKKFRAYEGVFYQLWAMLSKAREAVNSRVETPLEKFLVQDDDMKKYVVNFLSDLGLKEKGFRIDLNEKYRQEIEEALHLMDTNLIAFNEQKEELIQGLVEKKDLLVGRGIKLCLEDKKLEPMIYHWLLVNILRIFFKSNDYKISDESSIPANETTLVDAEGKIDETGDDQAGDAKADNFLKPEDKPVRRNSQASTSQMGAGEEGSKANMSGNVKNSARGHIKGPEITDEDRRIEALKKKLDIEFVPEKQQVSPDTVAIFRIRESLNRESMRPEIVKKLEEEKQRKKEEAQAIEDPKKSLAFHKKQYLLDAYLNQLKEKEEKEKEAEEEAERKKKEEYIEQYYGDVYDNDLKNYDFEDAERAASNINESLSIGEGREVLFIHRVNEGLFRKHIMDKMRETFKESGLIKDVDLDKELHPLDKEIEEAILSDLIKDKEAIPIFDAEL